MLPALPSGMEDGGKLVNLTAALLQRGYDEDDLLKVLGGNVLRVMDACQATIGASQPHHE
ncbi:MAG: membrane dipeptidase [Planctomycetes bacterium]|nr:membrane dipeptidase [Planctomycetota bacterium]